MEIIGPIATKISDYVIDAIFHELGYLVYYKDNMKGLKEQAENLVSVRSRVQNLIDEAKNKAEDVEDDVSIWLTNVDEITEKTYKFLIKIVEEKEGKCMNGSCFNFVRRHRLSRKAKKMVEELAHLQDQGKFDKFSYPGPLPKPKNTSDYVTFDSRLSILEDIIEALKDPNVSMIGVHGMGGIGKTMLVKDVSCRVMKSKLFEPVITVTIGQNPDVKQVQGQLADMLRLKFDQETEQGRAALLQKRLQKEKSILIILDDIWNGLDLERVGIPFGDDYEGCKILVTSRSIHVLSDKMNIEKNFEVKILSEEESWNFFKRMMGKSSDQMTSLEWKEIAINVAKKCGNLPIALATVAKALRRKHLHAWKDALRQLNNPATVDIEGVSKEVYASLRLSYDNLSCLEAKLLFLLYSMFPDDCNISKFILVRYAIGMKFLQGVDTLETTRNRIYTLVDDLESSCMLQKSEAGSEFVKMHDVVRDVAIYIASKNDQICTLCYEKGFNMWRDEDPHGHYTAVLANCKDLPKRMKFPKLEVLALVNIIRVPEEFFEGMEKLKVLHMVRMRFPKPPSSFHCMLNLRTLLLINCQKLKNMDMIVELKNLEILYIHRSEITDLPSSTCQLSRLKELALLDCNRLEVIQPEVISKLTKLEALIMRSFNGWDEVEGSKKENASLVELQHLPYLTTLKISVQNVEQLPRNAFSYNSKLDEFQIHICGEPRCGSTFETRKVLEINMLERKKNGRNLFLEEGIRMLLKKAEQLILRQTFDLKDALFEINGSDVLKILRLGPDEDVEYLANTENEMVSIFPNLEELSIWGMERLDRIIRIGSIKTVKIFGNLKDMYVGNCHKLKYLFPLSIMEALYNLEVIRVKSCEMLEAIFVIDDQKLANKIECCSQLGSLIMSELPQFTSICCKIVEVEAIDTEIVEEDQIVANLMTPFDGQVVFPSFKQLKIRQVKNVRDCELNGDYKLMKVESIRYRDCENLKSIFTHNTMVMLKEFRNLTVSDCDSLEEIFNMNEGDFIPSLTTVKVSNCRKLRRIFPTSITKHLHELQTIEISECGIEEVFSNNQSELQYSKVSFPNLEHLKIELGNNLEVIWQKGLIIDDLSNLKSLTLSECKNIKSVVTLTEVKLVEQLEKLFIGECDSIEEIFRIHNKLPHPKEDSVPIKFKLKDITLADLPNLKQLWSEDFDGLCHFPNLEYMRFSRCPKLRRIFPTPKVIGCGIEEVFSNNQAELQYSKVSFPNLEHLEIELGINLEVIWHNGLIVDDLSNLRSITLSECKSIKSVVTLTELKLVEQLKKLSISECESLEEIFTIHKKLPHPKEDSVPINFKLKDIELKELPNLKQLWSEDFDGLCHFPNLLRKSFSGCPKFRNPFPPSDWS